MSQDPEHRFELALSLGELQLAYELAVVADSEEKWGQLSQAATLRSELMLAAQCLGRAHDYGGLLLLATSAGSAHLVRFVFFLTDLFHEYQKSDFDVSVFFPTQPKVLEAFRQRLKGRAKH